MHFGTPESVLSISGMAMTAGVLKIEALRDQRHERQLAGNAGFEGSKQ